MHGVIGLLPSQGFPGPMAKAPAGIHSRGLLRKGGGKNSSMESRDIAGGDAEPLELGEGSQRLPARTGKKSATQIHDQRNLSTLWLFPLVSQALPGPGPWLAFRLTLKTPKRLASTCDIALRH